VAVDHRAEHQAEPVGSSAARRGGVLNVHVKRVIVLNIEMRLFEKHSASTNSDKA